MPAASRRALRAHLAPKLPNGEALRERAATFAVFRRAASSFLVRHVISSSTDAAAGGASNEGNDDGR
jgi:hypothetical protein